MMRPARSGTIRWRPDGPGAVPLRLRTHAWTRHGEERFLLLGGSDRGTLAVAFAHRPGRVPLFRVAFSCPRAIPADPEAVFDRMRPGPARRVDLARLGLIDGRAIPLILGLQVLAMRHASPTMVVAVPRHRSPGGQFTGMRGFRRAGFSVPWHGTAFLRALTSERPRFAAPPDAGIPHGTLWVSPMHGMAAAFDFPELPDNADAIAARLERDAPDLCGAVRGFAGPVSERLRPDGIALTDVTWSPRIARWLAAEGEPGRRRRQAARLHPGLAPLLESGGTRLRRAIDDGRPHEALLDAALVRVTFGGGSVALGKARIRRLRGLPGSIHPSMLPALVEAVRDLRPDRLPSTRAGWLAFAAHAIPLLAMARSIGLARDVDALVRGPGLPWLEPIPDDEAAKLAQRTAAFGLSIHEPTVVEGAMIGARDMAASLARTLIAHLPGFDPIPGDPAREGIDIGPAVRILFGGRRFAEVAALSRRWHDGHAAFLRELPQPHPAATWPALFDPVEGPGGVRLVCLSDAGSLATEGDDGEDGLAHCVGSYAPHCLAGHSHIVSVRDEGDDGRVVRLSTVEIENEGDGELRLVQHRGRGNAAPPQRAVTAVRYLGEAIRTGAIPLNPEALAIRTVPVRTTPLEPAELARAFEAWRPYLPAGIARRGIGALSDRIVRDRATRRSGDA